MDVEFFMTIVSGWKLYGLVAHDRLLTWTRSLIMVKVNNAQASYGPSQELDKDKREERPSGLSC